MFLATSFSFLFGCQQELLNVGAIAGADMTPEAALTKLSFVISKTEWTDKKKREVINRDA